MSAKSPNNNKSKNYFGLSIYWVYAIVIAFLLGLLYFDDTTATQDVSYTKFEEYVATGDVEKITVFTNTNKAEAVVGDSLAQVILKERKIDPAKTSHLYISTDIPSADKMKDQIDAWRAEGVF
ncbi:MAG: ATP-dependent metallopeptidase FtsH/Yme1/Tma family protein [Duncaniella sp.]|nr:ATP-dependent metallopeptidase FtsH/Yme1/Tma family protein [Duncaniella sp.]